MAFRIEPALFEDMDILYDIYIRAHQTDPLYPYLYPKLSWAEQLVFESAGPKEVFLRHSWVKYHKAVEIETGKIVAWSRWHFPRLLTEEEKNKPDDDYFPSIPDNTNKELVQEWFDLTFEVEQKYMDRENGYFINYLVVHPEYQRRGLGAKLMRIGLDAADQDGAKTFLLATAKGAPLYSKMGFKEVDMFEVDTKPYGGESIARFLCMIREANTGWFYY